MNHKANQHKRDQTVLSHERYRTRKPVPTFEQQQAVAAKLAQQVADHVANGGKVTEAAHGETAIKDYRNPTAPMSRAQRARR